MLIVLPSTPTTEKASEFLNTIGIGHQLISIPESLGYKTGADLAIYSEDPRKGEIATELTKQRFVVMRVFKDFHLPA
jgi:hypothetical protein